MFRPLIGKSMKVYVDDLLTKSLSAGEHVWDLWETFDILYKYNMKLNPKKCPFSVSFKKFMEFTVTKRGIEANPEKVRTIWELRSPRNVKEAQ